MLCMLVSIPTTPVDLVMPSLLVLLSVPCAQHDTSDSFHYCCPGHNTTAYHFLFLLFIRWSYHYQGYHRLTLGPLRSCYHLKSCPIHPLSPNLDMICYHTFLPSMHYSAAHLVIVANGVWVQSCHSVYQWPCQHCSYFLPARELPCLSLATLICCPFCPMVLTQLSILVYWGCIWNF